MKGHKAPRKAHKASEAMHHNKADKKHMETGGAVGNKNVLREAEQGMKGGDHIGGGGAGKLSRKRGGSVRSKRASGGEVGSDKHPYSSAH